MKRSIHLSLFLAVCAMSAHAQATVDGFSLDQLNFTANYSGNVPCSEYGQAGFAVRQFPGIVQYVQVVAQLAGSATAPAWIVQNIPAISGTITSTSGVDLTRLGVKRGSCITGAKINFTVVVTDRMIAAAPTYTGSLAAFVGQRTEAAEGYLPDGTVSPGVLPPPSSAAASLQPESLVAAGGTNPDGGTPAGDLVSTSVTRPGMGSVQQGSLECAPGAVANSMHWLQSTGSVNLGGDTPTQSLGKLKTDMGWVAGRGAGPAKVLTGKLQFSQRTEHPLDLNIHYQADQSVTGVGASLTAGTGTANRDGSGGPPTFDYIMQEMAKGQDVELGLRYVTTDAAGNVTSVQGGHLVAVSGVLSSPAGNGIWLNDDQFQNGRADGPRFNHWAAAGKNGNYIQLGGFVPNRVDAIFSESPKPVTYLYYPLENSNLIGAYMVNPVVPKGPTPNAPGPRAAVIGGLTPVPGSPFAGGSQAVTAASALGKFLYVVNFGSNNMSGFKIDQSSGALTPLAGSPFAVGAGPFSVVADRAGRLLYVGNYSGSTISAFIIDPITGGLTTVAGSPFSTGSTPAGLAVSPSGRLLFVANNSGVSVYTIDPATGTLTAVAGSPFAAGSSPNSVAVEATGQFIYVANAAFGTTSGSISAFSVGPTGALTPVPGSPFKPGTQPDYVVVDSKGKFVYVSNYVSSNVSAFTINPATGALTQVPGSPYAVSAGPFAVATDSASQFVYVTSQGSNPGSISAFTIDATSGALTPVAGSPFSAGNGPARLILVDVLANVGPANPLPAVTQLAPSAAAPGGSPLVLSVYGSNFVPGSVVRWNGFSRDTSYVSATRLDVSVPAADLISAGTPSITVTNPAPGGGTSNGLNFTVSAAVTVPSVPGNGTLNDAGFKIGMAVAPGSIAASFGSAMAAGSTTYTVLPPANLGGSSVLFNGAYAAPLFFTSSGQINMQVPWELSGAERAFATFTTAAGTSSPTTVPIAPFAPGVFTMNAAGQGAIVIGTGEVAGPVGSIPGVATKPTTAGDYLTIYCTGLGDVTNRPATGVAAPLDPLSRTPTTPVVTIGGVPAAVLFSGLTPTYVGLYQINVQVPTGVTPGSAVPTVVQIGGQSSPAVTIAVQ